jgi:hypothetical protein
VLKNNNWYEIKIVLKDENPLGKLSSEEYIIYVEVKSKITNAPKPIVNITSIKKIPEVVKKPVKNQKQFNASRIYLTAKIKSVSPYGTIIVRFSENIDAVLTKNIIAIFN